jgi:capsular polysaccharide biosynthesis protein
VASDARYFMLDFPPMTDSQTVDPPYQAEMTRSIFEPPSGFVLRAISRNKLIVLLAAVILALVGLGVGEARKPTYTAATTLQVGTVNLNSPGFDGFVEGASEFATVFSRAILAEPVLTDLTSKLGITPSDAAQRLSAAPVPLSPSFRIFATGATANDAIDLANTTSSAVIAYEQRAASATSPQAAALLKEYQSAALALQRAEVLVEHLSAERDLKSAAAKKAGKTPSNISSDALVQARAAAAAARTRSDAIGASYRNVTVTAAGAGPASGLVSLVAPAVIATNDRNSKIELLSLIGLFAGIIIGCAAAVLREWGRPSRRMVAEVEAGTQGSKPA